MTFKSPSRPARENSLELIDLSKSKSFTPSPGRKSEQPRLFQDEVKQMIED